MTEQQIQENKSSFVRGILKWQVLYCFLAGMAMVLILQRCGVGFWKGGSVSERIPLTVMEGTGFLALEAQIEGRAICMIVDTGASRTIFDIDLIEELQLTAAENPNVVFRFDNSDVHSQIAHVKVFNVGNLSYHGDFCFVALSRTNTNKSIEDKPIEGLLGAELLTKWNAVIDYKDLSLVIRNP